MRAALEAVGRLVYGDGWKRPLARAIGVEERAFRRYLAGTDSPSPKLAAQIEAFFAELRDRIPPPQERDDHESL